jgi:MYXO-CTERM domain-containing protein
MRKTTRAALPLMIALALVLPATAHAFCGFYVAGADEPLVNEATMVVMMREGSRTVLSMQNHYEGPPENFAMVVPVPVVLQEDDVKVLPEAVFDRVDKLASPRLVEYWEQDPCYVEPPLEYEEEPTASMGVAEEAADEGAARLGVTIEAEFTVGEYDIVILSAEDSTGLDTWLRENEYSIPDGAEPVLRPYVEQGMKFFVAKVDVTKVQFEDGQAKLSPLRFHYDSETFQLPVRLGLLNAEGKQDLIVHILAPNQRYEMANYENVTIPTNIDVANEVRERFGEFYAALFDETLAQNRRAVVTEYAWQATNCDPCPGPVLDQSDLVTLGADVLPSTQAALGEPGGPGYYEAQSALMSFVLTRLHTRYDQETLNEDLVFRAASPIVGGREFVQGDGELEHGSRPAPQNNFQGRYAIRHEWEGPIECDNPVRGRWGGPPGGVDNPGVRPAQDLAFAARGALELPSVVRTAIPELSIDAATPTEAEATGEGEATPTTSAPASGESSDDGCGGCATSGNPAPAALLLLGLVFAIRRRR